MADSHSTSISSPNTRLRKHRESGTKEGFSSSEKNEVDFNDKTVNNSSLTGSVQDKNNETQKKRANFIVRTIWTVVMIAGFFALLFAGHVWMVALIACIQILTFKEVIKISSEPAQEKKLPLNKSLNWYFLVTTLYFLYGENIIYYFKHIVFIDTLFLPIASHHRFISFALYIIGFIFFVYLLQKGQYSFQFKQFCITHMTLLFVVIQADFVIKNIFNGLYWFFLPACLVIINDIFAYLCGMLFGKHQLTPLSPKKTVEGFLGAWLFTILIGNFLSNFLINFNYMICPAKDISINVFSNLTCVPNPVFISHTYPVPSFLQSIIGLSTFSMKPIQFHIFFLASFASLIAPFGGFFASGLKRMFKVKDFGDVIPGHGGIADRMDCQFIMGFFVYMYYDSFISFHSATVGSVLATALSDLDHQDQLVLVATLHKYLYNNGVINADIFKCLGENISDSLVNPLSIT